MHWPLYKRNVQAVALVCKECPTGLACRGTLFTVDRHTHAHHVPHAEHVESSIGQNGDARSAIATAPYCPSPILFTGQQAKVNRSGGDAQVVSCHHYLVVFHPFVKQLTVFRTSRFVLASSFILRVLDFGLHRDGT